MQKAGLKSGFFIVFYHFFTPKKTELNPTRESVMMALIFMVRFRSKMKTAASDMRLFNIICCLNPLCA